MSGPRIGELFAGYGGLGLGVQAVYGGEVVWVSEFDKGPSKILKHRFPGVPNHGDITKIDWSQVEPVDILTGGSPCQDLSHAGRRAGMTEGTRSNLWVAMREAIAQLRPAVVVWENVRGALSAAADSAVEPCPGCVGDGSGVNLRALGRVVGDLAELGYVGRAHGLLASDVGAPHGRFREFLVAEDAERPGWGAEGHAAPGQATGGRTPALAGRPGGVAAHEPLTGDAWIAPGQLMPTPRATDGTKGGPTQRGSSGDPMLPSAVALLPTPTAQEPGGTAEQYRARWVKSDGRSSTFVPLSMAVNLLPTPSVADVEGGRKSRSGARSDELLLNGIAHEQRWGEYAAAIARWEHILGRPAPEPTQTSSKGNPQLSARFVEWMMGLPAGWVTDVPGTTRNEALKALGNGVVPQQAAEALRVMASWSAVAA